MKRSSVVFAMIAATATLSCTVPPALGQPADQAASTPGPALDSYGRATVPQNGLVVVMGDDLAYGADPRGSIPGANGSTIRRSSSAISEQLQHLFGSLQVENRGYPGDTLAEGIKRWENAPAGNLLIIAYGLGDARAKTPPEAFADTLRNFIRMSRDHGAAVFVIVWPALKDPALSAALEPYRIAERTIAPDEGAAVIEAYKVAEKAKVATTNRSYQEPELYSALAGTIASYVRVSDVARRPPAAEVANTEGPRDFPAVLESCRTAGNDYEALSRTHPIDPAKLASVDQRLGQCRSGVLSYRARHPQAPFQCRVALESQALIFGEAMRDLAIASSRARRDASLTMQVRRLREQYAQTRGAEQRNSEDLQRCP